MTRCRHLLAATLSSTGIRITWEFPSRDPAGFQLDRRRGDGPWTDAAFPGPAVRSFDDGDLQPRTNYTYRLRAFDGPDTSAWTPGAPGSTLDLPPVCSLSEGSHDFGLQFSQDVPEDVLSLEDKAIQGALIDEPVRAAVGWPVDRAAWPPAGSRPRWTRSGWG